MAEKKSMVRDLTTGSISKNIVKYAMPLMLANSLQAIYNIADMMVVGQIEGGEAMAGVSLGGELVHLVTFLIMGFTASGQIILAQFVGANKKDSIKRMIGTMFTISFILAAVLFGASMLLRDWLLHALNADVAVYDLAKSYLTVCTFGIFFIAGYNVVCSILRGMGDSKHPCIFIVIASVLNIVLDIWFVAGLKWSTFGAALATVIGQGVSFIVSIIYLYIHKEEFGFDFRLESFRISKEELGPLIKLGIPMSIQLASVTLSKTILSAWINSYGWEYTALTGLFHKMAIFISVMTNAFTTAGAANVAQNIGAEKYERVPKILGVIFAYTVVICGACTILIALFPSQLFSMFTTDARVIELSGILVLPMVISNMGAMARSVGFSLINGSGNSKLNLIIALVDGIVARLGLAFLLGNTLAMGCQGFWLGDSFAGYVPLLVAAVFFLSGKWRDNSHIIRRKTGKA